MAPTSHPLNAIAYRNIVSFAGARKQSLVGSLRLIIIGIIALSPLYLKHRLILLLARLSTYSSAPHR